MGNATSVFAGLRVVELAEGMAGAMAAMIMADNGADVIKVEPRSGDFSRHSPGFLMWNRGKKSVMLDHDEAADLAMIRRLIRSADVVISTLTPGTAVQCGIDYTSIATEQPDLVYCEISGFGLPADYERMAQYDELVLAKSGRVCGNDAMSGAIHMGRPIYITAPIPSFGAAGLALQGIAAALLARCRDGRGRKVETSLLDGISATTMRLAFERKDDAMISTQNRDSDSALVLKRIALCFMTPRCKDGGYLQMCARQERHFRNWLQAMELAHLLDTERFGQAPLGLKTNEDIAELTALISQRMLTKTRGEWIRIFSTEWDVGGDPFLTPEEFLRHPQMLENDRIVELDDPVFGKVTQVGALVHFSETPSHIERSAPQLGEHQVELPDMLRRQPATRPQATPQERKSPANGATRPPLEGITVLELAYYLAAPLGATLLAEMGARVIKIEPLEGDPMRKAGLEFVHLVHGKESLPVDLKTKTGQDILRRVVAMSDAVVHNFRPGVPERLGLDYETLRRINPSIVYLYGASYGSNGPEKHRPAFHSTPHALNGGGILQAGLGNPPVDDSYPDPCSGIGAGMALAMGLLARERTGKGQTMETTMLTSSAYVHSERLTHYRGMPRLPMLDGGQYGLHSLNRLYPTRRGWLMLGIRTMPEWLRLADALARPEALSADSTSSIPPSPKDDAAIAVALASILAERDADAWEHLLLAANVPAAAVASSFEAFSLESGILSSGEHPTFGTYWRLRPRMRFSPGGNREGAPCAVGENTTALLSELGYTPAGIGRAIAEKAVANWTHDGNPALARVTT